MKQKNPIKFLLIALVFSFYVFSCATTPSSDTEAEALAAPVVPADDLPAPPAEAQLDEEIDDSPLIESLESFPEIILPPAGLVMERPELPELPLPEFIFPQEPESEEELAGILAEDPPLMEEPAQDAGEAIPAEIPLDMPEPLPQLAPAAEVLPPPEAAPVPALPPVPVPSPPIPPAVPPFIAPAEPIPPAQQPLPVPAAPFPDLPSRPLPERPEADILISRTVRATVGQIVEIPFTGIGWVYLGELANRQGISYESRRLDVQGGITLGQSFIFHCEEPGIYILRFYRRDFIQDYIINDYVQVIVGEAAIGSPVFPIERGRVIAEPRWPGTEGPLSTGPSAAPLTVAPEPLLPEPVTPEPWGIWPGDEEPIPDEAAPSWLRPDLTDDGIVTVAPPQAAFRADPVLPLDEYIRQARQEFDAGRVENALLIMDTMRQHYPQGSDEAWWLYAQLLEANSSSRDIALALEFYRRILREYPQSNRAGDAQRRISYLERFFFNIR